MPDLKQQCMKEFDDKDFFGWYVTKSRKRISAEDYFEIVKDMRKETKAFISKWMDKMAKESVMGFLTDAVLGEQLRSALRAQAEIYLTQKEAK